MQLPPAGQQEQSGGWLHVRAQPLLTQPDDIKRDGCDDVLQVRLGHAIAIPS